MLLTSNLGLSWSTALQEPSNECNQEDTIQLYHPQTFGRNMYSIWAMGSEVGATVVREIGAFQLIRCSIISLGDSM